MHPLIKLCLALALLIVFMALISVIYLDSLLVQVISFFLLSLGIWLKWRFRRWYSELKLLLPFILTLLLVYLLFGIFGVRAGTGTEGSLAYWLLFGVTRVLMLLNSILAVQLFLSVLSFDDLLRLPLKISLLKYVILLKLLFSAAFQSHGSISLHLQMIPSEQAAKLGIKHKFNVKLASALALLSFILSEATLKGELIDNRIAHCHPKEKQ